jgi:putative ABC transport system substrate-binding protein
MNGSANLHWWSCGRCPRRAAWRLSATARQNPAHRIFLLRLAPIFAGYRPLQRFCGRQRELGYVEGKNVAVETRFGDGKIDRLPGFAAELVRSSVDVIVAAGSPEYSALRFATTSVPVIVTVTTDPVIEGLAANLARPGGNFTGLTDTAADLGAKQLELLQATVPQLSRLGACC